MRHTIKFTKYFVVFLFFSNTLTACSYLQKVKDRFQNRPEIEGAGAEDIANIDIDTDKKGSDTGQIEGLSTVHFSLDSSELSDSLIETLNANKAWLDDHSEVKKIHLEGHCDPLGSEAYNLGLGERRAQVVFTYLISMGLRKDQLSIVSYGEEKLFSETDHALNRRVNFVPQY